MRRLIAILLLMTLFSVQVIALGRAGEKRNPLSDEGAAYVIPSPILKITSLEFGNIVSDFLFLKATVFLGGVLQHHLAVKNSEWRWFYNDLNAATELDPYFLDPYYLGNAHLTWEAGMINETNTLLEKGSRYRQWDWMLPFFLGFNYFYFLQDNNKASEYLMEASRKPGASPLFASLAARLAYKGNNVENAIFFLEEITKKTDDESLKKAYRTRIEALRGILSLDKAVDLYKRRFGKAPADLNELIERKVIQKLPRDPYGGTFYMGPGGKIKTTSDLKLLPH